MIKFRKNKNTILLKLIGIKGMTRENFFNELWNLVSKNKILFLLRVIYDEIKSHLIIIKSTLINFASFLKHHCFYFLPFRSIQLPTLYRVL